MNLGIWVSDEVLFYGNVRKTPYGLVVYSIKGSATRQGLILQPGLPLRVRYRWIRKSSAYRSSNGKVFFLRKKTKTRADSPRGIWNRFRRIAAGAYVL